MKLPFPEAAELKCILIWKKGPKLLVGQHQQHKLHITLTKCQSYSLAYLRNTRYNLRTECWNYKLRTYTKLNISYVHTLPSKRHWLILGVYLPLLSRRLKVVSRSLCAINSFTCSRHLDHLDTKSLSLMNFLPPPIIKPEQFKNQQTHSLATVCYKTG